MRRNNKTQIQQITNYKHVNTHIAKLNQHLTLCHHILQINSSLLMYLPHTQQPSLQAFLKLYNVQVTNRENRQLKAIHLASAYFSTPSSERQYLLRDKLILFLSKLRVIPAKIRILLELESLINEIYLGIELIANRVKLLVEEQYYSSQPIEIKLDGVISPNQLIGKCQQLCNSLKRYSSTVNNSSNHNLMNNNLSPVLKNKQQLFQFYYSKQQLSLESNFITLMLWRYSSCIMVSLIILQKQSKQRILKFIKQTKQLMKSSLIHFEQVANIYAFCLSNICKNSASQKNTQTFVYFQLELKKLFVERKHQLTDSTIDEVQSVIKMVTEVAQKHVGKKDCQSSHPNLNVTKKLSKQTNNFISNEEFTQLSNIKNISLLNKSAQTVTNKYTLSIGLTKPSLSQLTNTNRQFLATNRFSLTSMSKHIGLSLNKESQSLNKIKEYQLSLRKTKDNESKSGSGRKKVRIKEETVRSMYEDVDGQNKETVINKNVSFSTFRTPFHQLSKGKSMNNSIHLTNGTSTSRRSPFTKRLYQSLRQSNSHSQQITIMSLQNEMLRISEVIYEKPHITFQQITRDMRFTYQMQCESQSTMMRLVANEAITAKIQVTVSCLMLINGWNLITIEIQKQFDEVDKFQCMIRQHSQFIKRVNLQPAVEVDNMITLKSTKSTVQSTDLFFELMQQDIKLLRSQATTKALIYTNNLQSLEQTDNQTYIAYFNVFNTMTIIGDYMKPYVYWYWTRRSKMNGVTIAKRENLQMSDPLKFSINLQSLKKNDLQGCISMFKTLRSKKALKQCITYLSQGREILCRRLTKTRKGQFILQLIQLQHKYMRNFSVSQQNELTFPVIQLLVKRFKTNQQYKTKQSILIERAFKKLLFKENKLSKRSLLLKKRSNKTLIQTQQQQVHPVQSEQRINMHNIFNNAQCNQLLIDNITRNFIPSRFINKIIAYLEYHFNREQQQWRMIQNQLTQEENNNKGRTQTRIKQHETEQNRFDVIIGAEDHNNDILSHQKKQEINGSLRQALRRYIISVIGVVNEQQQPSQQMDWSLQRRSQVAVHKGQPGSHQQLLAQQQISNPYAKQKSNLHFVLHSKLVTFSSFLISMSQTYQQPMIFSILATKLKKIKVNNSKFYTLQIYKFVNLRYFIILRDNHYGKQWVMYVSEKMIKLVDALMFKCSGIKIKRTESKNVDYGQEGGQKKIGFNNRQQVFSYSHQSNSSVNNMNDVELNFMNQTSPINRLIESSQLKSTLNNNSTPPILISTTTSLFIPSIFNSQSPLFHFYLLKTPYMSKLSIHRKETGTHFISRVNSKNNKFSILLNWLNVLEKKVVRLKDVCQHEVGFESGRYAYLVCSYDVKFGHLRFDIYLSGTQQKFVVFADIQSFRLNNKNDHTKLFNLAQFPSQSTTANLLTTLINSNMIHINLHKQTFTIASTPFKMFQTFDQLTLPHKDITLQQQPVKPKQQSKTIYQTILQKRSQSYHFTPAISRQKTIKNSGLIQLLKHNLSIRLLLLDYNREQILMSEVQQDPQYLFNNIYAECSYKQTLNVIYQNLLRRTYQKVQKSTLQLAITTIKQFGKVVDLLSR